jgi:hypothetical protein
VGRVKTTRMLRVIDCLDLRVGGPAVCALNSAISASRGGGETRASRRFRCGNRSPIDPPNIRRVWASRPWDVGGRA